MAVDYCVGCHKKHKDWAWRYGKVWDDKLQEEVMGAVCRKFFQVRPTEFVPDRIKEDRKANFKSLLQPFREGQLSKEFAEAYPQQVKNMVKSGTLKPKEVKEAKHTWKDLPNWSNRNKTK